MKQSLSATNTVLTNTLLLKLKKRLTDILPGSLAKS